MWVYVDYFVEYGFVVFDFDSFGLCNFGGGKVCESIKS